MPTETVEYVGVFDEVEIEAELNGVPFVVTARKGEPVDVPAELAGSLVEQETNWRRPGKGAAESKKG